MSSSLNPGDGDDKPHDPEPSLARLDALPADSLHEVEAVLDREAESLLLYRTAEGDVRAWLNVCPHAGRRLDWAPGKFLRTKEGLLVCAAHGASFELTNGVCVAGPCRGEALRQVDVEVRGDAVWLVPGS